MGNRKNQSTTVSGKPVSYSILWHQTHLNYRDREDFAAQGHLLAQNNYQLKAHALLSNLAPVTDPLVPLLHRHPILVDGLLLA